MMDVFYIEFQDENILTKDETLLLFLKDITGAYYGDITSEFSLSRIIE